MLDVLHYLFEEDLRYSTGEQAQAVEKTREIIYGQLYNTEYIFKVTTSNKASTNSFNDFDNLQPFDPNKKVTKPFIPATQFDPDTGLPLNASGLLEAPLK